MDTQVHLYWYWIDDLHRSIAQINYYTADSEGFSINFRVYNPKLG